MLVKAAYVHPVRAEQDPCERAMFVLSQRDMALLGVEDSREFLAARGRGVRRRLPEDEEGIANVTRGFVGRVMASGRRLRSAVGGDAADLDRALNYWLLLSAPLRDAEGHTIVGGRLRGFTVPVWNVLGVYPVLASEEDVEATTERLRQEDRSIFRHSYTEHMTRALLREAETEGEEFSLFLAYVYRQWGLLLGFPVCQALLVEGERLYDEQMRTGLWQPRLEAAYAIMGKTRRAVRDEYTVDMLPFGFAAREMSDTTEFESFGWDLPVAMLDMPYEFVGPAANPGTVVQGAGSAMERRFPFWAVDVFARSVYRQIPVYASDRAVSIVREAIRHIESRNYRAFTHYDGIHPQTADTFRFNFDRDGLLPTGSTAYSRRIVEAAVSRRYQEHELVRTGALQKINVGDDEWVNFYKALAGFLGVPLLSVPFSGSLEHGLGVREAIDLVCVEQAGSGSTGAPVVSLRHRSEIANDLAALCVAMQGDLLAIGVPATADRPQGDQLRLTRSQAAASRMISQWPVSVVLGNPGTGKTFAVLREMRRFAEALNQHEPTQLIVLTPTNKAAIRVGEVFGRGNVRFFGLQQEEKKEGDQAEALIHIGTVDSFLRKVETSEVFRSKLERHRLFIAVDEAGMLSPEKFSRLIGTFRDPVDLTGLGQVVRMVLLGDTAQLESVEAGSLLQDVSSAYPVTTLVEQQRYQGALVELFDALRGGLSSERERGRVVDMLVAHAENRKHDEHLRVYLIDDLPSGRPPSPAENPDFWERFGTSLGAKVRDIVFREVLRWQGISLGGGGCTPRMAEGSRRRGDREHADYEKFIQAVVRPEQQFRVATLTRKAAAPRTFFISSADRINNWFVNALMGRLPQEPGYRSVGSEWMQRGGVLHSEGHPGYVDGKPYQEAFAAAETAGPVVLDRFLHMHQPRNLYFAKGWPYVVQTNNYKRFGLVRKEVVTYHEYQEGHRTLHYFLTEDGRTVAIPADSFRGNPRRAFAYGWAVNVHQMQGSEFPVVIQVWLDGLAPGYIHSRWDRIQSDGAGITPLEVDESEALDARLDLRAFYTAVTRTNTTPRKVVSIENRAANVSGIGGCVIIAGRYALRRFLSLGVHPRRTPFNAALRAQLGIA